MHKKSFFALMLFVGILLLIIACSTTTRHYSDDPFYSSVGDWDSTRFPLVKPYEAASPDGNIWEWAYTHCNRQKEYTGTLA